MLSKVVLLSCGSSWGSVDLVFNRFSNFYDLSEASAEIFHLEVGSCQGALVFLRVIIVRIDTLVILKCCGVAVMFFVMLNVILS